MALLAGILGGVFGIGGGMLISPLLLQVGVSPEVKSTLIHLILMILIFLTVKNMLINNSHSGAGNGSNLFVHGVLLVFHVGISVLVTGHGARRYCTHLRHRVLRCIASRTGGAAESNQSVWKGFTNCVLSEYSHGLEHCSDDYLWGS